MSKSDFGKSPDTIVLLSPGLNEKQIWGEKLAVRSEAKYLGIEFPNATIYQYGIEDLERIAAMKVDLLISYFTGPRPPWRIDNIAELVEGVTILKVVNHGDLLDEFAELPVDGFITNSVAAANLLGKRRPAAYISLAVELIRDGEYREHARKRIEAERHVLFEDMAPIRALESFLAEAAK